MPYKTIKDLDLDNKKVLVRLDLNVPIKEGKITDYTRIEASLPTIKYIIENNGKAILMSHLGRPGGEKTPALSLKIVADALNEKLVKEVGFTSDCIGEEVKKKADSLEKGSVLLLENLRFHTEEKENDQDFVSSLASIADIYVNDAFGTAHRKHASTYGVPILCKEQGKDIAAGFLMSKELETWKPIIEKKGKTVAIIGGAKLKEKMKAVKKFSSRFDRIIIGGVVANVFMKAKGYDIGNSRYLEKDKDYTDKAKEILEKNNKISIPSIVTVSDTDFNKIEERDPKDGLKQGEIAADVIPSDEDKRSIKEAEKIVWFGPLGAYEFGMKKGSLDIVEAINQSSGYAVIGGGDLAAAAEGIDAKISTGGGASIEYITSGTLAALEALRPE